MEQEKGPNQHERRRGFTLIELMVVIAILAVLATLVVPNLLHSAEEGNVAAAKAQISAFKTALMSYRLKLKKFPASGEGLEALISNSAGISFLDAAKVPKDPWGNPYRYSAPGTGGHDYEIVCYGRDGQSGGIEYDADIVSWDLQGQ